MKYQLARSRAGHDKDRIYVCYDSGDADVLLFDGRLRLCGHPKKKRRTHIQPIRSFPEDVQKELEQLPPPEELFSGNRSAGLQDNDNLHAKRALKLYQMRGK